MHQLLKEYLSKNMSVKDEHLSSLSTVFHPKTTKRNEILLEAGSICRYMYFVNKGCLRVYLMDEGGRESTRFLVPEGRFGTAFPSFILHEPSLAYIQSVEPSELLYRYYSGYH